MSTSPSTLESLADALLAEEPDRALVWLDSALGGPDLGERSLLALEPEPALRISALGMQLATGTGVWAPHQPGCPWRAADAWLRDVWASEPDAHFVGWIAWEAGHVADAAMPALVAPEVPVLWLGRVRQGWVERGGACEPIGSPNALCAPWDQEHAPPPESPWAEAPPAMGASPDQRWHEERVADILEAILSGRVYQACLTFPIEVKDTAPLWRRYRALRRQSPGDYSAFWQAGGQRLACSSPERFLDVRHGEVFARPMKGTRPRSDGPDAARALAEDPKDRAENIMIVDLLRNDLHRVCVPGTVHVPELCVVEPYRTVWQMTSTIAGQLRPEVGPFGLLQATFPPGSMSGAPKIEAVRLLTELEAAPRGLYAGSLFWLDGAHRWSFNVVIRSLLADADGGLRWPVGGGIVAASHAEDEWREAWTKSAALGWDPPPSVCRAPKNPSGDAQP